MSERPPLSIITRFEIRVGVCPPPDATRSSVTRPVALLRLYDGDGCWGQGEASPLPGFSPDCFEDAVAELKGWCTRKVPLRLDEKDAARSAAGLSSSAARFAVETALLDLLARRSERPLHHLLGSGRGGEGIAVNALLDSAASLEALEHTVSQGLERGVHTFKAKIGRGCPLEDDLRPLFGLRERFGSRIELRLDANGAWGLEVASAMLARVAPLEPEYVEQPVGRRELPLLERPDVPVAADESLQLPELTESLIDSRVVSAFVIKPHAVGGLIRARQLAELASSRGLKVVITHLLDGPIGVAAAAALALSLPARPAACGLAPHPALALWGTDPPGVSDAGVAPHGRAGTGLPPLEPPR